MNDIKNNDLSYGALLKSIFDFLKIKLTVKKINETTSKIVILTSNNTNVWFENDIVKFTSMYDEYFVKDIDYNLVYEVIFDYIKRNNKYNIMVNDNTNTPSILFTIPESSIVEELKMKLDLILT